MDVNPPRTWLRRWRDRTSTTQDSAAAAVGISRNRWSEIEAGQDCLLDTARKIEDLTGIAPKDWHRTDEPVANGEGPSEAVAAA